jgi:hypothetical protein
VAVEDRRQNNGGQPRHHRQSVAGSAPGIPDPVIPVEQCDLHELV